MSKKKYDFLKKLFFNKNNLGVFPFISYINKSKSTKTFEI